MGVAARAASSAESLWELALDVILAGDLESARVGFFSETRNCSMFGATAGAEGF